METLKTEQKTTSVLPNLTCRLLVVLVAAGIFALPSPTVARLTEGVPHGTIVGTVVDKQTGEPLAGANILIEGTQLGAAADLEGRYQIHRVPVGTYTLVFRMMGYSTWKVQSVRVRADQVTKVDAALALKVVQGKEVVVEARAVRNTEASLLRLRQRAASVSDAVSAEAIKKTAGANAAEAIRQVTGASVLDGRQILIRGLGERYTSVQLNSAEVPSSDPYSRRGAVDLIPSNLVDNIVVSKSFTPDKPGDFAGGVVDVQTRDFPDRLSLNVSTSVSYNSQTTLRRNFLGYSGGRLDWLGFDDGTRALPAELQTDRSALPEDLIKARRSPELARKLDRITREFHPQLAPTQQQAPVDGSLALAFGNRASLFGRPFGFLLSASYRRKHTSYESGRYARWRLVGADSTKRSLDNEFDLRDAKSASSALLAGMLRVSYLLAKNHRLSLAAVYNHEGKSEARLLRGHYPYDIDPSWTFQSSALLYTERFLSSYELEGEHSLPSWLGTKITWRLSSAQTQQEEPDLRYFTCYITDTGLYGIKSNLAPERYWRTTSESRYSASFNVTLPLARGSRQKKSLSFGFFGASNHRDYVERTFKYQPATRIGLYLRQYDGDINRLLAGPLVGIVDTVRTSTGREYYNFGITVSELDQTSNSYWGDKNIGAAYAMVDWRFSRSLRLLAGLRYETTGLRVQSLNPEKPHGRIATGDALPAVNFLYQPSKNANMRFAYGRTLARPSFREIAPFASFDFKGGTTTIGNPALKRTTIDNLDLRYEIFPAPGEVLAIGAFYKIFHDPVEPTIIAGGNSGSYYVQWRNVTRASVKGIEFEIRKNLSSLADLLNGLSVVGNLTLIHSEVKIDPVELSLRRATRPDASATRPFQGQSPVLLNVLVTYSHPESGLSVGVYYNYFGKRLTAVSLGGTPDVYELPATLLNVTVDKRIFHRFYLRLAAKNLLDTAHREIHSYRGHNYIYSMYRLGKEFSMGLSYRI